MTLEEIKELIQVVNESGIAELELQRGENRVRIRRSNVQPTQEIVVTPATPALASSQVLAASQASNLPLSVTSLPAISRPAQEEAELVFVKSPIVGTYYDSPTPDAPPFVKVGDRVGPGQVLCIIESMKLMNEIEAEVTGIVAKKLVENGRPVEYGEALFGVQPA